MYKESLTSNHLNNEEVLLLFCDINLKSPIDTMHNILKETLI